MHIGMIAMQDFTARKADIARVLWRDLWVWATRTQQRLREALGEQYLTDMWWAGEQIGVAHLLRGQGAAQDVYRVFVADDVPAWLLLCLHADMVAEIRHDDNILLLIIVHHFTAFPVQMCYAIDV